MTGWKSAYRDIALFPVTTIHYPYHISTVFMSDAEPIVGDSGMLDHLLVVDYRYARFALNPRTGLFTMVKYVNFTLPYSTMIDMGF